MERESEDGKVIRLQATTKIDGVVIPTWLAISFGGLFIVLLLVLSLTHQRLGEMRSDIAARDKIIEREIRLLQLHAQAVQNTLIQNELAKLEDFPPLESPPKK